jgi:hypothetical protein
MDDEEDVCIVRAQAKGKKNGQPIEAIVDVIDCYARTTGFTAMERTTGWHISIIAAQRWPSRKSLWARFRSSWRCRARLLCAKPKGRGFKITERCGSVGTVVEKAYALMGYPLLRDLLLNS